MKKLPTLTTVLLWMFLLAGAWNGLIGGAVLLLGSEDVALFEQQTMKLFVTASSFLGFYFIIASIMAIRQKEAGRKGIILGLIFLALISTAWMAFNISYAPHLPIIVLGIIVNLIPLTIIFLIYRHFVSDKVRKCFQ